MIVSQFYSLSDTFKFGQYKGMALSDVIDWDYQYIYWCMNSISNMEFLIYDSAIEELKQVYPHFYISNDFENKRIQRLKEASNMTTMLEDNNDFYYDSDYFENKTNEKYSGFYAQDEMGYNDDEIDTIFDGNPDAYWNID